MANFDASHGFNVFGWMVTELNLGSSDLMAFAVVHQFTQGFAGKYTGNTAYLSAWFGWTEKTARAHLARLVDMGLIVEVRGRENNSPYCHYELHPDFYKKHPVKITVSPGKNYQKHPVISSETTRKNLPSNNNIINNKNIDNNNIPPTPHDVVLFAKERGFIDPEGFSAHFMDYYGTSNWHLANGKPMKDWRRAVITWEPNNKYRNFGRPQQSRPRRQTTTEDLLALGREMFGPQNHSCDEQ